MSYNDEIKHCNPESKLEINLRKNLRKRNIAVSTA